ncbi:MAG: LysR family transcriptional regulator [Betaproteobacteria bacterium]|nr:MAG: LysR family transcriptional regulator [Betaproteobacteria bacterium]
MRYSLVDLRLIVAIADAGNVSRGAARCHLAPSSASLRIRQLEESLGAPLFERRARGVSLTRAGRVMLEHCRRCLAELEQMHADLAPFAGRVTSRVVLFATSSAVASFLPDDVGGFLRAHPDVRIALEEHVSQEIVAAVASGRADVGVVSWDAPHRELAFHPYRQDELVVVVPAAERPRPRDAALRFADCLAEPLVSPWTGSAIHAFLAGKAAELGKVLDVRIQVSGFAAVVALIRAGAGIGIVPRSVLRSVNCEGVAVLRLDEPWAQRRLAVCTPNDPARAAGPAALLARDLVRRAAAVPRARARSAA